MISVAGEPLRMRLCTLPCHPSKTAARASSASEAALLEEVLSTRLSGCLEEDRSLAKAIAASGRITATIEISVTFSGSANDLNFLAAVRDCRDPSVAMTTCMTHSPKVLDGSGSPRSTPWDRSRRPQNHPRSEERSAGQ